MMARGIPAKPLHWGQIYNGDWSDPIKKMPDNYWNELDLVPPISADPQYYLSMIGKW